MYMHIWYAYTFPPPSTYITIEISIYKGRKQLKCGIKSDYGEKQCKCEKDINTNWAAFASFGVFPHIYLTILEFIIDSHSIRHILCAGGAAWHPSTLGHPRASDGLFGGRGLPCAGIIKMHNMARWRAGYCDQADAAGLLTIPPGVDTQGRKKSPIFLGSFFEW